jgi:hypothetical protein
MGLNLKSHNIEFNVLSADRREIPLTRRASLWNHYLIDQIAKENMGVRRVRVR